MYTYIDIKGQGLDRIVFVPSWINIVPGVYHFNCLPKLLFEIPKFNYALNISELLIRQIGLKIFCD